MGGECRRSADPPARRIDKNPKPALPYDVPRTRRIAAFLLLALWLPAMLHCRLEAAGLLFATDCCSTTPASTSPAADHGCADDSCDIVEGEFTSPTAFVLKAPSPDWCACLLCGPAALPPVAFSPPPDTGVVEATSAPPELAPPWVLVVPGSLSPRAP